MTTQTRMTLTVTVNAKTYGEVMKKALELAHNLGIENPTFMEATPVVGEMGSELPFLWEVEIDHRDIMTLAQESLHQDEAVKPKRKRSWMHHLQEDDSGDDS